MNESKNPGDSIDSFRLSLGSGLAWVAGYFGVMLLYTALDVVLWRKLTPELAPWLNLAGMLVCIGIFFWIMITQTGVHLDLFRKFGIRHLLLAMFGGALLYLVMDCGIDPILENLFMVSESQYQEALADLRATPVTSFLQVCLIAPVTEELLMRGFVLKGLRRSYSWGFALIVSAALFGILHMNLVQGISAFAGGLILGGVYLRSNHLLSCMLMHAFYNGISFVLLLK